MILIFQLFWTYSFLITLVFALQGCSHHCKSLVMLLSQFPLALIQTQNGMLLFTVQPMTILVLIGMVFMIISEMISSILQLGTPVTATEFYKRVKMETAESLIANISGQVPFISRIFSCLLLPYGIEITSLNKINSINLLHLK